MAAEMRLIAIGDLNPIYASDILTFIELNPVFEKYLPIASITPKALIDFPEPNAKKDCLKYYVCFAGVRNDYGNKCWNDVQKGDYSQLKKKRGTIEAIDKLSDDFSVEDARSISGIGDGAITFLKQMVLNDFSDCVYPTDISFRKGLKKIYSLDHVPNVQEAKKIVSTWK